MLSTNSLNPLTIRQQLHLSQEKISNLLHVSNKTLWRWENTQATLPEEALRHLAKLKQIAELADKVYGAEAIEVFLLTPMEEFGNLSAYEIMALGKYDQVIAALAADYEGLGY